MADPVEVRTAVEQATDELAQAQADLLTVLDEIEHKERADKTMISSVLREALARVSRAQRRLALLRPEL
ncbi:MAG: hypothetical protein K1X88_24330 [Nannocystaceae bacterium]|nr:hypothetical protein [Nannocystaceae bacterium]